MKQLITSPTAAPAIGSYSPAVLVTYFSAPYPARATAQVAHLPRDVKVEIDAIAVLDHENTK